MTERDAIQAISVNMMRMAEWYYTNPQETREICQRYLDQSWQLAEQVTSPGARAYLDRFSNIQFSNTDISHTQTAEQCLTLGVLLQSVQ